MNHLNPQIACRIRNLVSASASSRSIARPCAIRETLPSGCSTNFDRYCIPNMRFLSRNNASSDPHHHTVLANPILPPPPHRTGKGSKPPPPLIVAPFLIPGGLYNNRRTVPTRVPVDNDGDKIRIVSEHIQHRRGSAGVTCETMHRRRCPALA